MSDVWWRLEVLIVIYIYISHLCFRCRHGVFADYFGDKSPPCKTQKQCDVCRNPGNVEKSIEEFYRHISKGNNRLMLTEDGSDLYGGGREGQKM